MAEKAGNFGKVAKKNPILIEHEVGKTKQTVYDLPNSGFTYGKPLVRDKEGAGAVVLSWEEAVPNPSASAGRDFKALNKQSVGAGITTSKNITEFRKTHDARLAQGRLQTLEDRAPPRSPDFSYGIKVRPSTPVHDLIQSRFEKDWYIDQKIKEEEESAKTAGRAGRDIHTKTSLLRQKARSVSPKTRAADTFVMKRFQNVESRAFPK